MKCQKCGKNEVNFHYSSNVNGTVTEAFLCSVCARDSGYDMGSAFSAGGMFDGFLTSPGSVFDSVFGRAPGYRGRYVPMIPMQVFGFSPLFPVDYQPYAGDWQAPQNAQQVVQHDGQTLGCACGGQADAQSGGQADAQNGGQTDVQNGGQTDECACARGREEKAGEAARTAGVDAEINKRREINAMREQMRLAAKNEDFEKAAELRDMIRGME